jgi:hypothetical protein
MQLSSTLVHWIGPTAIRTGDDRGDVVSRNRNPSWKTSIREALTGDNLFAKSSFLRGDLSPTFDAQRRPSIFTDK